MSRYNLHLKHEDLPYRPCVGVMLLNRALTVAPGAPASHRGKGWEAVTEQAIDALARRGGPLVAVLWGRDAHGLKPEDLPHSDAMRAEVSAAVEEVNAKVGPVEQIKKFTILPRDFTQETGELTPTLKVKRNVVAEQYANAIEALYTQ